MHTAESRAGMNESNSAPRTQPALMSLQQFQQELRRLARFGSKAGAEDPLAWILETIVQNPAFSESRLLTRLLTAVTYQTGEFRFAEAAVFHSKTLAMIVSFLDMRLGGSLSDARCRLAVEAAGAAQLEVDR